MPKRLRTAVGLTAGAGAHLERLSQLESTCDSLVHYTPKEMDAHCSDVHTKGCWQTGYYNQSPDSPPGPF